MKATKEFQPQMSEQPFFRLENLTAILDSNYKLFCCVVNERFSKFHNFFVFSSIFTSFKVLFE